jgi:hypothetical protein
MTTLAGQLLVAMPQMLDPRFARSVVYLCAHSEDEGAMGLVVNKLLASLSMDELFTHLNLEPSAVGRARPVHFGGPVEPGRGFVLHTADYREEATLVVGEEFAITATLDILRAIGLVQVFSFGGSAARYEASLDKHHHLLCSTCRALENVQADGVGEIAAQIAAAKGFSDIDYGLTIVGRCESCGRKPGKNGAS